MPSDIISKDDLVVTDIGKRRGKRQRHMQRQREDRERERGERQTKRLYVS